MKNQKILPIKKDLLTEVQIKKIESAGVSVIEMDDPDQFTIFSNDKSMVSKEDIYKCALNAIFEAPLEKSCDSVESHNRSVRDHFIVNLNLLLRDKT